ncbi:MAG: hypothetical protein PHH54_00225 [Candidatus Nanoarchaeia archaeon]|nr:hypothetical protein [Candidatus Nanoarchaeia archaeon]MDD5740388.1 hypothetical protein [Candidatus Nanoarchaeia archaeon]
MENKNIKPKITTLEKIAFAGVTGFLGGLVSTFFIQPYYEASIYKENENRPSIIVLNRPLGKNIILVKYSSEKYVSLKNYLENHIPLAKRSIEEYKIKKASSGIE